MAFMLENYEENAGQMGAWYNDLGDLGDDIKGAAQWIWNQSRNVQHASQTATNVANNAANIGAWRLDGNTVVLSAVAIGALLLIMNRRR